MDNNNKNEKNNKVMYMEQVQAMYIVEEGVTVAPVGVCFSVWLPLCCYLSLLTQSHRVSIFKLEGEGHISLPTAGDVARLVRLDEGHPRTLVRVGVVSS